MKTVTLSLLAILMAMKGVAQQNEPVVATINYDFVHVFDLSRPVSPVRQEMILRLGKSSSRYTNFSVEKGSKPISAPVSASGPVTVTVGKPMAVVTNPALPNGEIFEYISDNKLVVTASLGIQAYQIDAPLAKIDWKINDEKRKIGSYSCQKATGHYGGRTWYAWFCSDLPFQSGPWKLSGLPGLILEAKDSTEQVQFLFKEISKDVADEKIASNRLRLVTVSQEAFDRAKSAFQDDPSASMQSQLKPGAPEPTPAYVTESGKYIIGSEAVELIKKQKKELRFNPIELK